MSISRIGLLGFGEVGQILAADLSPRATLAAWDLKLSDPRSVPSAGIGRGGVRAGRDAPDAARDAELVISAVTAAQAVEAARAAGPGLARGAVFLDLNSASPGMKQEAARALEAAGGRYVEAAVMASVPPLRSATPMLFGGPHAEEFLPRAHALGFTGARFFSPRVGPASAAKMCRSVIIKGMEALLAESMLCARRHGVEETVLDSLVDTWPGVDWARAARYMIGRSIEHGVRRSEEMEEVARTVEEAGLAAPMSRACAERQAWAAQFTASLAERELGTMLDAILGSR